MTVFGMVKIFLLGDGERTFELRRIGEKISKEEFDFARVNY